MTASTQQMHPDAAPARPAGSFLTTRDVQELIRVDKSTIYRMAEAGRLPAIKVGRQWRFPADEIERWLRRRRNGAAESDFDALFTAEAQHLTDLYAELMGVMAVVTDMEGRPITTPSHPCGYFRAIAEAPRTVERCVAEWKALGGHYDFEPTFNLGHLGFLCARAFIRVGNRLEGMVIAGCVAPADWPPPARVLEGIAAEVGADVATLDAAVDRIYHLTEEDRRRALDGLSRLAVHLSRLAAKRQSGAERTAPTVHERRRAQ